MRKKRFAKKTAVAALLLVTMVMTGCGKSSGDTDTKTKENDSKAEVTKEETKSAGSKRTDRIFGISG